MKIRIGEAFLNADHEVLANFKPEELDEYYLCEAHEYAPGKDKKLSVVCVFPKTLSENMIKEQMEDIFRIAWKEYVKC